MTIEDFAANELVFHNLQNFVCFTKF